MCLPPVFTPQLKYARNEVEGMESNQSMEAAHCARISKSAVSFQNFTSKHVIPDHPVMYL